MHPAPTSPILTAVSWVAIDVAYTPEPQPAVAAMHSLNEVTEACWFAVSTTGRVLARKAR